MPKIFGGLVNIPIFLRDKITITNKININPKINKKGNRFWILPTVTNI
jgi:hypothetical protein